MVWINPQHFKEDLFHMNSNQPVIGYPHQRRQWHRVSNHWWMCITNYEMDSFSFCYFTILQMIYIYV